MYGKGAQIWHAWILEMATRLRCRGQPRVRYLPYQPVHEYIALAARRADRPQPPHTRDRPRRRHRHTERGTQKT